MTDLTFSVPEDLLKRMEKYPEIKWDTIALAAVEKYIEKLEITDKLASNSELTLEDAEIIGNEIKRKGWEKHKKYLETSKK
ncbi:hypothetical protein ES703_93646 [subsurface metagenome]